MKFFTISLLTVFVLVLSASIETLARSWVPYVFEHTSLTFLEQQKNDDSSLLQPQSTKLHHIGTILAAYIDPRADTFAWFHAGSCTVYIAKRKPELFFYPDGSRRLKGNAEDWLVNAQKLDLKTWSEPKLGAIAVYYPWQGAWEYGHVGFVEDIQNDGTIIISEMDYETEHMVTHRVVRGDLAAWYIY